MDRIDDLVQLLEPEVASPPPELQVRQRDALLQFMAQADKAPVRAPHPGRPPARRRVWYVAIAGAAAVVAAVTAIFIPGSSPPHPPIATPGTSAVLTAVNRALANVSSDIEEVRTSTPAAVHLSSTSWIDLATGACRTDTAINGQPSLTVLVRNGTAVFIDYGLREWWTRSTGGVTCEPLTPQKIEHDLSTGHYTLARPTSFDGEHALELASTAATALPHGVTKMTTLWVDATNYLPIESISIGHASERTVFTWMPDTSSQADVFNLAVPAGFRHVAAAPVTTP